MLDAKIAINNRCNLNCDYCFLTKSAKELSIDCWVDIFAKLKSLGVEYLDFFGKEPLFDDKCFKIIEKVRNIGIEFNYSMITNGKNLPLYADLIKEYFNSLTISYSGVFNSGRKFTPPFDVVYNIADKIPIEISYDLQVGNFNKVFNTINFLRDIGVSSMYINPIIAMKVEDKPFVISENDLKDLCATLETRYLGINVHVKIPYEYKKLTQKYANYNGNGYLSFGVENSCLCDGSSIFINSDGVAYPCVDCVLRGNKSRGFDFLATPLMSIPKLVTSNGERLCRTVRK